MGSFSRHERQERWEEGVPMRCRYNAHTGLDGCCFYVERGRSMPRLADSCTVNPGIAVHESGLIFSRISPPVSLIYFQGQKGGVLAFQSFIIGETIRLRDGSLPSVEMPR